MPNPNASAQKHSSTSTMPLAETRSEVEKQLNNVRRLHFKSWDLILKTSKFFNPKDLESIDNVVNDSRQENM